jgi:hypothetical protein
MFFGNKKLTQKNKLNSMHLQQKVDKMEIPLQKVPSVTHTEISNILLASYISFLRDTLLQKNNVRPRGKI